MCFPTCIQLGILLEFKQNLCQHYPSIALAIVVSRCSCLLFYFCVYNFFLFIHDRCVPEFELKVSLGIQYQNKHGCYT
ncbi:fec918e6-6854-48dc-a491-82f8201b5483 [Sclerotinia trifoliorum]|uniref:Fec918e6-6854-48dc-a491-82f8201b5483 n=1 Tax=Sclerotinia trifoliorum TaxID=28548 RepID=A0A8H2ZPG6_9HELO|nr:fec918e6-6854-48dc-a491-82f8201b5483 [Sclerotinia trifoliorum]